jgi:hypothetical protein
MMSQILSFRDLDAWRAAMELVATAYSLVGKLPVTETYGLSAQMRRAAVSIPSNIAEGHAGGPGARYRHHVRIALGSLADLTRKSNSLCDWDSYREARSPPPLRNSLVRANCFTVWPVLFAVKRYRQRVRVRAAGRMEGGV